MNPERQMEIKSRLRLIDDEPKPLTGSYGQYTRLALVGYTPEKGQERFFTLFAESEKLFRSIHTALKTPEWIRDGFENKWMYIEEVLRRPGPTDDISGYLQAISQSENDIWVAVFEYIKSTSMLEEFAQKVAGKTYGIPSEDLPSIGFPEGLRFVQNKKSGD